MLDLKLSNPDLKCVIFINEYKKVISNRRKDAVCLEKSVNQRWVIRKPNKIL